MHGGEAGGDDGGRAGGADGDGGGSDGGAGAAVAQAPHVAAQNSANVDAVVNGLGGVYATPHAARPAAPTDAADAQS